jgi:uncharacterized metal-binding protein YceD (DUF177 family)
MDTFPLSSIYDLSDLSEGGTEVTVTANPEQRAELAKWADVSAVSDFHALVTLRRISGNRFAFDATLSADIVQACVVTLEPVRSHLTLEISRVLHLINLPLNAKISAQEISPGLEEDQEEIQDTRYNIAAPLLEEFALAIDPYPRCPGVAFEPEPDGDTTKGPFEALKSLKGQS